MWPVAVPMAIGNGTVTCPGRTELLLKHYDKQLAEPDIGPACHL